MASCACFRERFRLLKTPSGANHSSSPDGTWTHWRQISGYNILTLRLNKHFVIQQSAVVELEVTEELEKILEEAFFNWEGEPLVIDGVDVGLVYELRCRQSNGMLLWLFQKNEDSM